MVLEESTSGAPFTFPGEAACPILPHTMAAMVVYNLGEQVPCSVQTDPDGLYHRIMEAADFSPAIMVEIR